jgi:hypothetical protein
MRALWGRMKMPPWLDTLNWGGGSRNTVHGAHELAQRFELVIAKDSLDIGVRRRRCRLDVRKYEYEANKQPNK